MNRQHGRQPCSKPYRAETNDTQVLYPRPLKHENDSNHDRTKAYATAEELNDVDGPIHFKAGTLRKSVKSSQTNKQRDHPNYNRRPFAINHFVSPGSVATDSKPWIFSAPLRETTLRLHPSQKPLTPNSLPA